jgi:hypothetical protein
MKPAVILPERQPAFAVCFALNADDLTIAADRRLEYILHR